MMQSTTFYWYDYETFGLDTIRDRPAQFAGMRTTLDFESVGEADVFYCRPSPEYLPNVMACVLTGITPQQAAEKGTAENEFAKRVHRELNMPATISVGYNTIGFDDKVNRSLFWRNLLDMYGHVWRNGCSRWDLYPFVLAVWALRPEDVVWPTVASADPQKPFKQTFKLEKLTVANQIEHSHAHDASSDVAATIALARFLAQKKQRLWQWALENRSKQKVAEALDTRRPCLWVDPRAGQEKGFLRFVMPVARNPNNPNEYFVWDCREDPQQLVALSCEEIARRAFAPASMRAEGETPLALRRLRINECPFVCSDLRVASKSVCERFGIDLAQVIANGEALTRLYPMLEGPILQAWQDYEERNSQRMESNGSKDAEAALYDGFVSDADRAIAQRLQNADFVTIAERVHDGRLHFEDERLNELLFRMRARCAPETLNEEETQRWQSECRSRLTQVGLATTTLEQYFEELERVQERYEAQMNDGTLSEERYEAIEQTLSALYDWGDQAAEYAQVGE